LFLSTALYQSRLCSNLVKKGELALLEIIEIGKNEHGRELTIRELIKKLEEHPLDPAFEESGNFIFPYQPLRDAKRYEGCRAFFGDFAMISCRFFIVTDEKVLIDELIKAIKENQERIDYGRLRDVQMNGRVSY
jgi:hypothetical protein